MSPTFPTILRRLLLHVARLLDITAGCQRSLVPTSSIQYLILHSVHTTRREKFIGIASAGAPCESLRASTILDRSSKRDVILSPPVICYYIRTQQGYPEGHSSEQILAKRSCSWLLLLHSFCIVARSQPWARNTLITLRVWLQSVVEVVREVELLRGSYSSRSQLDLDD
ncbi:hypothetical protein EJ03DRAFT_204106 [Teratosphaeria nubilosa]|uniref:Uncharacterized protein n=1 Tax=Teratosphaeria nubilosa TaxID=161662 RepID=A0A6G1LHL0_9PEZI|nr:hypothetical protein EJ03DRAFT_204106 [Teratosphaeria nubilosa]